MSFTTRDVPALFDRVERDHLIPYAQRMYPNYQVSRHISLVADQLERVMHKDLRFLAIMMPPRMSKSTTASEIFPSWFLGHRPDDQIILASHTASLAKKFSRRARRMVESPQYPWPEVKPSQESRSTQEWEIAQHMGSVYAVGVGGAVGGRGAHCLVIDDAVRNAEDADSEVMREKTWEWFEQDAYSRLQPGGAIVLVGTRWHEADLIGRALNMSAIPWEVMSFPAEAETSDALGREPGEWLWPEWKSPAQWEETKAITSPRSWNALYQQRPSSEEGAMFPRSAWQWYTPGSEPQMREIIISVDSAFKEGVGSDYSVFAVWGHDGLNSYYLLDLWRGRVEFPDLITRGNGIYGDWLDRTSTRKVSLVVEDKASGQSAIQVWRRPQWIEGGKRVPALTVQAFKLPAGMSKEARADGITHLIRAGRVYLPHSRPWTADFVQEHVEFPLGTHDDQVDSTSIALSYLTGQPRRGMATF